MTTICMHNFITPVNNTLNQIAAQKSKGIPNELGKIVLKKKWLAYFVHGHTCNIPIPRSPSDQASETSRGRFQRQTCFWFCKFEHQCFFLPSDIKNENTIGERQIKRPRERDVERDGGSLKGRDLTRCMLHVYKMTIALFCHYSGCAVLESDGVQCAG